MRIGIFGTGYVGLVTAVCLADLGHSVTAADKDPRIVGKLAEGEPTIYEPGLGEILVANLKTRRLRFTTAPDEVMSGSDVVFLCVGTPPRSDGHADLSQVGEVVRMIAPMLDGYKLIVEKSSVPANTATWLRAEIDRIADPTSQYDVASNPEFLREGSAIHDFLHPDRIVIGVDSERARSLLLDLYRSSFACPLFVTDVKTAEIIKHAANAFLATKISFMNMIADLCDEIGADVVAVSQALGLDRRIGRHFLDAGLGFGGSCLPKDLQAFIQVACEAGVDFALLREVERINVARTDRLLHKVDRALDGIEGKTVAILGVTFKPNTDDVRESPSLRVIPKLKAAGAALRVYDPQGVSNLAKMLAPDDQLRYAESAYDASRGAHALVILTDWSEFRELDLQRIRSLMQTPIIADGRNLFDPVDMRAQGFEYYTMGRGDASLIPCFGTARK